ncbi:MAG TPA: rhomboid family intramembrane serine protease [Planctomycetota bacterium]|nr:rhomboid family intramembrane serine protease [Planctomycetota bacterium]
MKGLLAHADEVPVTLVVALAYVTLSILTDPFHPTGEQLDRYGWLMPALAAGGEPWRMLTCAFLHGGILHLAFNLMMLLQIGPALERSFGSVRFAVLYVVSALGASIGVCLLYGVFDPVVGGSGALFGMLGALVAMNMRSGRHLFSFLEFEGPRRLLGLIVANLVIGWLLPFISNTAHIAGLITGFGVTFLWLVRAREPSRSLWQWRLASAALFASMLFASLVPVTRYDWLHRQAEAADPAQQPALRRAAVMARTGQTSASDGEAAGAAIVFDREFARMRGH